MFLVEFCLSRSFLVPFSCMLDLKLASLFVNEHIQNQRLVICSFCAPFKFFPSATCGRMAHCSSVLLLCLQLKTPLQILLRMFAKMPEVIMEKVMFGNFIIL